MKVYVICEQCEDSYYPGHIAYCTKVQHLAFLDKSKAEAKLVELNANQYNGPDETPWFYITEVEVLP